MSDRASHLARKLVTRLIAVEMGLLDDAGPRDKAHEIEIRRYMVSTVLAAELGVTDEATISRVVEFLPHIVIGSTMPEVDHTELASLLRNNLRLD